MSYELKGKLTNGGGSPLSYYIIKAYDKDPPFDILGDDPIGEVVTLDDGTFKITFRKEDFRKPAEFWESPTAEPNIYMKVFDNNGTLIHETPQFSSPFTPYTNPNQITQTEVVVTGSGFGGTIVSLSLANQFTDEDELKPDADKRKVVILERGQWWVSHELPLSPSSHEFEKKPTATPDEGIREYLDTNDIPHRTWAHPDNLNGMNQFLNTSRIIDRRGLYDYRISKRVHTLAASGVGGGSLVYTNVTEEPNENVIDSWDSQLNLGINYANLKTYFDMARGFIGVNKIPTNTALGTIKLPKTKAFQDAARKIKEEEDALGSGIITNKTTPGFDPASPDKDPDQHPYIEDIFAVDLSISDFPYRKDERTLFNKRNSSYGTPPSPAPIPDNLFDFVKNSMQSNSNLQEKASLLLRKYMDEPNICERQGRCALGCIPGARHTNNKKIFDYLNNQSKKKHLLVYPLCEVFDVEPLPSTSSHKYKIHYIDFGSRQWKQDNFSWPQGPDTYNLDVKMFSFVEGGTRRAIECKKLVLAAGAIGSTEILLKSVNTTRTIGLKLKLSTKLGNRYSTNGDLLGVINPTKTNVYATRGPIVTSAIKFKEGPNFIYTIEDSSIPKMFSGISKLLSNGTLFRKLLTFAGTGSVQSVLTMISQNPPSIPIVAGSMSFQFSENDLDNVLLLSGMGTDSSDGIIKLKDTWKNDPDRDMTSLDVLDVDFDLSKLSPLFSKMIHQMERIAKTIGKDGLSSFSTPLWDSADIPGNSTIVLHNLGGCSMGNDRNEGVVDDFGKVFKGDGANSTDIYDNLRVVDGGIVPTSLGVNSSLTISALAFRIA
jgi:choline dehydrogenase-like flavoprotein